MHPLAQLDQCHVWHPFTQMRDWLRTEPIVIVEGDGALLRDVHGREYLDANASIWTNLHGHRHPAINRAIRRQLGRIAHSSALGLANEPAALLAERLVQAANPAGLRHAPAKPAAPRLAKVFFSDDGSTAMEVALKLAYEFARRSGRSRQPRFVSLGGAYHGDTVGAVSVGHIDLFHRAYAGLLFKSDTVMAPYCYRCPYNRAKPERADARVYRRCRWECLDQVERRFSARSRRGDAYAALVVEPLIQGAAGMIPQPAGWLRRATDIARQHGALLIADEVMTGFGRTGTGGAEAATPRSKVRRPSSEARNRKSEIGDPKSRGRDAESEAWAARGGSLFACHHEGVQPDFLALAKGLTGGYLPMAATLTTPAVFDAFLGEYAEFKTFFHGHSFTANQLGAAAGNASLALLQSQESVAARRRLEADLRASLPRLWASPHVGDLRQVGLVAGIELVRDWRTRVPFDLAAQAGLRVCSAMARRGVLTRPIGNVIVLMPPYCATRPQVERMVEALAESLQEFHGG